MANFPGLVLTQAGRNLQAKAQIGAALTFTRVALGDGTSNAPDSMSALDNERLSLSIQEFEVVGDGTSRMRVIMTNEALEAGFFVRELGVFAEDPDTGDEQLYSYSNAGEQPDFLPAGGGATLVENVFDLYTVVGNAQNVTAKINDYITIATKQDIDKIRPLLLPEDGTVNQLLRKASNASGDTVWFTPEEGIGVQVESREERRVAVEGQRTFALTGVTTQGLAVYVNGERYGRHRWQPLGATQMRFQSELSDGDEVLFVQNEEVGEIKVARISLTGEGLIYPGTTNEYVITDFDFAAVYSANASRGTLTRDGDTLTLVLDAGEPDGALDLNIARDGAGVTYALAVGAPKVRTPQITYPGGGDTGVDLQPTFSATAFATYPANFDDHASSTWTVARDEALTDIVIEVTTSEDLTSWRPDEALPLDTDLFVGVTYTGATLGDSDLAAVLAFRTTNQYIMQPTITAPVDGAAEIGETPTLSTTAFETHPSGSDIHASTDWQVSTASDFSSVLWESLGDTTNLESIDIPAGVLSRSTSYYVRARHSGNSLEGSEWSAAMSFMTSQQFTKVYSASSAVVRQINPNTMEVVASFNDGEPFSALAWGDDGYLYYASDNADPMLYKIDPETMDQISNYAGASTRIASLCWGGDGYVYCGSSSSTYGVEKLDPDTMSKIDSFTGSSGGCYGLVWGGDGCLYAGYSVSDAVRKIDPITMTEIDSFHGHTSSVVSLTWGGDGYLYSVASDATVRKIDPVGMTEIAQASGLSGAPNSVVWGADGYVYVGLSNGALLKISTDTMSVDDQFTGHTNAIRQIAWGADGYVYSVSDDDTLRKIDVSTMSESDQYNEGNDIDSVLWGQTPWDTYGWTIDQDGVVTSYEE